MHAIAFATGSLRHSSSLTISLPYFWWYRMLTRRSVASSRRFSSTSSTSSSRCYQSAHILPAYGVYNYHIHTRANGVVEEGRVHSLAHHIIPWRKMKYYSTPPLTLAWGRFCFTQRVASIKSTRSYVFFEAGGKVIFRVKWFLCGKQPRSQ